MNIQLFFEGLDCLFSNGDLEKVEPYFQENMEQAMKEQDISARISILNEMMGFYRETSQYDKARKTIQEVLELIDIAGLADSLPHATTLLNAGNALRAAGDLEQAMKDYSQVFALFEGRVPRMDFRYAELYNNVALLYQELGRYDMACQSLQNALEIVEQIPGKEFQQAVTLTNLGVSELQLINDASNERQADKEAVIRHLQQAISIFRSLKVADTHMAAALSAMGEVRFLEGDYEQAEQYYEDALEMIEKHIGRTEAYRRVEANLEQVRAKRKASVSSRLSGLELSRQFYQNYGVAMIHNQFSDYEARIAVGFAGEGSDRFGFDDEISEDHDFGAGFCMWLTDEDYAEIGEDLQRAYGELIEEAKGLIDREDNNPNASTVWTVHSKGRFGVLRIHDFYEQLTGYKEGPKTEAEWMGITENRLAAAVNGIVFRDDLGEFSRIRSQILHYYPDKVWLLKLAQYTSLFAQYGQYNYPRMAKRKDWVAAEIMRGEAMKFALNSVYLINRRFCPHDKWLSRGIEGFEFCEDIKELLKRLAVTEITKVEDNNQLMEAVAATLLEGMAAQGIVRPHTRGDILYMEGYGNELAQKAEWIGAGVEELAEQVAELEFRAFDKVKNEGGRAGCQDDWYTFRIMRVSQYLTWTKEMLIQYRMDFEGSLAEGWNMITEKYGRMMESTAPEEYVKLAPDLPAISEDKRKIVEEIVRLQVNWMEAFQARYPRLAGNARSIHTSQDTMWNTSYETYLRGELLTYSDRMLILYGRMIAQMLQEGCNLAEKIMQNTVLLYGYNGLQEAEDALAHGK